ncbi:hypothetical protein [Sphingomonas sp. CFBP 13706]|uniref:hypothetical protein n=1 Tax=Sphingomonas sp. CFBP 13706 TaxID=2775314 RepID=UPI0017871995|nr:hypothetical protein [Sphingomonas sp. CFBP 13706]MBD8737771.1 hypothetical protein [Sphingomonas sp. CFBP 13706]
MTRDDLLDALNKRVPYRIARRLLVASGFPTGHGWDAIHTKLKEPDYAAKANDRSLHALYVGALASAEKRASIYDIGQANVATLDAKMTLKLAADKSTKMALSYPLPLSASALTSLASTDPVIAGKSAFGNGSIFIICYIKESRFRVTLSPTQLNQNAGSGYAEVYGIRIERTQIFDAIIVPKSGDKITMLTDILENSSQDSVRDSVSRLDTFIKKVSGISIKGKRVNLFPAIAKFYNDPATDIIRLEHTATDGQAISERTKGAQKCLRVADYHKGGMGAVSGGTDAFGVEVAWTVPSVGGIDARIELSLIGSSSLAYDLNPVLDFADIGKVGTVDELMIALNSLHAKL